jgi:AcrR family transcriptional regulator
VQSKKRPSDPKLSFIEEARRRQIIEATIAGVAEEGYAGASLAKVAARAGISKSVVVYYFGGKDELLETTLVQIFGELREFLRPRMDAETTARGQLRAYIESEFAFLEQHRPRLLTISYVLMNHRDRRGKFYLREDAEATYLDFARKLLEKGQRTGEFRAFAVKPMAATLMHAINGALAGWVADPKLSLADYAAELVTIFDLATRKQASSPARRT